MTPCRDQQRHAFNLQPASARVPSAPVPSILSEEREQVDTTAPITQCAAENKVEYGEKKRGLQKELKAKE